MPRRMFRPLLAGALLLGLVSPALTGAALAQEEAETSKVIQSEWSALGVSTALRASPSAQPATPPLPDPSTFPVQLVLDDDNPEGVFGLAGAAARPFLWLNSFDSPGPFTLEEIWVLFPSEADVAVGGAVQLAVWTDPDGDPRNGGATLLATYDVTIQADDGDTFSVYPLAPALEISGGDVLIGVINRYFDVGVDPPPTRPAAYDGTASQTRSYFALWPDDPPNPPDLATASVVDVFDGAVTGNFMIRGFGTGAPTLQVPTLDRTGLAAVALALALAGAVLLRRRS